ncbi:zinc/manganese transport system ATP-binding protein [Pseudocitrobacter faecalis]|uniref:Zinc/manganese transport system ATP-binding protein n=1 Tax=Pseudocitrobacter faecalis TaxID=1398493 RepID=A0ABX9G261_9ENTR|nr:zinc/manganese transport system ATP-binding protein [Pseudocitrobacter faecalis]
MSAVGVYLARRLVGGITAMIVLDNLCIGYDGEAIASPVDGRITRGNLMAIVGANGCGKSTLLKTLAGFIPPVSGKVRWQVRRPVIGWLAQRQELDQQFPLTVQDVVSQGAWPRLSLLYGMGPGIRKRIATALERVGLLSLAKAPINTLSGGQFQRMLFARILVQQAPLVMLDEPFTGVDETTTEMLMSLILDMQRHGQTVLAVLHDSEKVARFFPQVLELGGVRAISPLLPARSA